MSETVSISCEKDPPRVHKRNYTDLPDTDIKLHKEKAKLLWTLGGSFSQEMDTVK
jgi:hypothetical protein